MRCPIHNIEIRAGFIPCPRCEPNFPGFRFLITSACEVEWNIFRFLDSIALFNMSRLNTHQYWLAMHQNEQLGMFRSLYDPDYFGGVAVFHPDAESDAHQKHDEENPAALLRAYQNALRKRERYKQLGTLRRTGQAVIFDALGLNDE